MLPIGGEDWDRLESDLVRTRATGDEPFVGNERGSLLESPHPGEPIWRDAGGVRTRRFNWRQARPTCIGSCTRAAYFVFDAVAPNSRAHAEAAAVDLRAALDCHWPGAGFELATLWGRQRPGGSCGGRVTAPEHRGTAR